MIRNLPSHHQIPYEGQNHLQLMRIVFMYENEGNRKGTGKGDVTKIIKRRHLYRKVWGGMPCEDWSLSYNHQPTITTKTRDSRESWGRWPLYPPTSQPCQQPSIHSVLCYCDRVWVSVVTSQPASQKVTVFGIREAELNISCFLVACYKCYRLLKLSKYMSYQHCSCHHQ